MSHGQKSQNDILDQYNTKWKYAVHDNVYNVPNKVEIVWLIAIISPFGIHVDKRVVTLNEHSDWLGRHGVVDQDYEIKQKYGQDGTRDEKLGVVNEPGKFVLFFEYEREETIEADGHNEPRAGLENKIGEEGKETTDESILVLHFLSGEELVH